MAVRFPVMQNNPHLLHTALERLYGDHRIGAVLDRHFPNLREMPNYSQLKQLTLGLMRLFIPRLMSPEKMQVVAHELDEIDLIGR